MLLLMTQMIIISILWMLMYMLKFKKKNNVKMLTPFECGYNPQSPKLPNMIQFTLLVMIFLVFDIELSILISSSWTMFKMNKWWILSMSSFAFMILVSIMYEMMKKSFMWK